MEEQAGEDMDDPELRRRADLRYRGQSFELTVEADDLDAVQERFAEAHERRYGYRMEGEDVELVNARVVATLPVETPELAAEEAEGDAEAGQAQGELRRRLERGAGLPARRHGRGLRGQGPGDRRVRRGDLRRAAGVVGRDRRHRHAGAGAQRVSLDPVTLSVLASALSGIAEEAGAVLIRGAYSSNIKERRDCSAALFDAKGAMVAQAEHIPVHLGAMPEAVAAVIEHDPDPGDVWIVNDPYRGGTHLPDITLVSPLDVDGEILAYAVTRAHHSDVGGMRPGSMPSDSREVYQEGIVIPPLRLGDDVLELILANVRTPDIRRGDLRAQTAANRLAGRRLEELVERRGRDTVEQAFEEVVAYAERRTREALREVPDGTYEAERAMEGDGVTDDDVRIAAVGDGRRRRDLDRLLGHRRPGGRQRQLPAVGHALGVLLRAARAAAVGRPRQRRHLRGAEHRGARGLGRQRAVAGRGGGRQRRDVAGDRRHRARRARARPSTSPPRARGR